MAELFIGFGVGLRWQWEGRPIPNRDRISRCVGWIGRGMGHGIEHQHHRHRIGNIDFMLCVSRFAAVGLTRLDGWVLCEFRENIPPTTTWVAAVSSDDMNAQISTWEI